MFEKIKRALVESFVGTIAVGWLFAESINHLIASLTTPLTNWWTMLREQQQGNPGYSSILAPPRPHFPIEIAIPQLIDAALLLLISGLLFCWLYLEPACESKSDEAQKPEREV